MASVALMSISAVTHMLLIFQTATVTLDVAITGLLGLPSLFCIALLALTPWLSQCQQFNEFKVEFLLMPHFVGFDLCDNLLRCVGQGVNFVLYQLGVQPPIIILWYTLYLVIGVLALRHCTTNST
jgi:hypothetical protein